MENPIPVFVFVNNIIPGSRISPPPSNTPPAVYMFSTSAEESAVAASGAAAATEDKCLQLQHCTHLSGVVLVAPSRLTVDHVRDHNGLFTWDKFWY